MTSLVLFHNTYRCTGPHGDKAADLVLLHGWGLHSIVWDDIMPGLLQHFAARLAVTSLPYDTFSLLLPFFYNSFPASFRSL